MLSYWEFCTESNWNTFALYRQDVDIQVETSNQFLQEPLIALGFYDALRIKFTSTVYVFHEKEMSVSDLFDENRENLYNK